MTDPIIIKARELFVAAVKPGYVRERAALSGAYDEGTDIQRFIPEAERILIANRPEAEPE